MSVGDLVGSVERLPDVYESMVQCTDNERCFRRCHVHRGVVFSSVPLFNDILGRPTTELALETYMWHALLYHLPLCDSLRSKDIVRRNSKV